MNPKPLSLSQVAGLLGFAVGKASYMGTCRSKFQQLGLEFGPGPGGKGFGPGWGPQHRMLCSATEDTTSCQFQTLPYGPKGPQRRGIVLVRQHQAPGPSCSLHWPIVLRRPADDNLTPPPTPHPGGLLAPTPPARHPLLG
ncbi:unnamed protein product [Merluccius merluccius]